MAVCPDSQLGGRWQKVEEKNKLAQGSGKRRDATQAWSLFRSNTPRQKSSPFVGVCEVVTRLFGRAKTQT
ncbi:hypothetical protein KIN20_018737 [Parelaphostrongylus tenuis]|uniref:Uncharacterized protein n=1 Tax=Parelaphostrongylus tenuis TaxID=148309 RepID=A0AAD5N421_PARTN|nr:hypothetical protein KIN20_018737 [Parelaphostrongylus tenuis]